MKTTVCDDKVTFEGFLQFVEIQNLGIDGLNDESSGAYKLLYQNFKFAYHLVPLELLSYDPYLYQQAVYNYALHVFVTICFDANLNYIDRNRLITMGMNPSNTWRNGIVQNASDNATSVSYMTPDFYKNLSLNDFDLLRTPYGRAYLKLALQIGNIWGLSK